MTQTLLLNASYEPLCVISSQRVVVLVLSDRAEIVEEGEAVFRSPSVTVAEPLVARLTRYVRRPQLGGLPVNRKNVLIRDRYTCGYCEGKADTIDHVIPRAHGGRHEWRNVVAACRACNNRKGSRTPAQAGWELAIRPSEPTGRVWFVAGAGVVRAAWRPYLASFGYHESDAYPSEAV